MTPIQENQRARFYINKKQKPDTLQKQDYLRYVFIHKKSDTLRYAIFHEIFELDIYIYDTLRYMTFLCTKSQTL